MDLCHHRLRPTSRLFSSLPRCLQPFCNFSLARGCVLSRAVFWMWLVGFRILPDLPSPSNLLLQPLTRVSETTESSSETPQISAQAPISLSSVPAASQVSVCSDMNCEEVANWVISIENMTAGGKARLEKYILEQNITGNFLMKMRNKLQIIK